MRDRLPLSRNTPLAVMLAVFGLYLLTMSGHVYSPDEETMLALSRSLVEHGSWVMEPVGGLFQVEGVDGKLFSEKGPGQSFFAAPWTALGLLLGSTYPEPQSEFVLQFVLGTYNALIGAGTVGLTAALALALGYSRLAASFLAALLAFSTFLWPTSRTFFAEPLLGLFLLASFYLLYLARSGQELTPESDRPVKRSGFGNKRAILLLVISGILFGWAVAVKVQGAIALPAYLLYIALKAGRVHRGTAVYSARVVIVLRISLLWLTGLTVGIAPYLLYNWQAFGSPFATGYGYGTSISNFDTPLYQGVYGLLLSPGKGLFWYAPPVLLALLSWGKFARRHRAEAWFIGSLALIMLAVFGSFAIWHGDGAWGPRFLVPLLPFALLPALPLLQRLFRRKLFVSKSPKGGAAASVSNWGRFGIATIVSVGFFVNFLGSAVNFDTYLNVGYDGQTRYWYPYASPIVGHLGLFDVQVRGAALRAFPRYDTAYLLSGFSYTEGNKAQGRLLPRWTTGDGSLEVRAGDVPISVTLRLADHRPPELPRADVKVWVNGTSVPLSKTAIDGAPSSNNYTFQLPISPVNLQIKSDTWNPAELPGGGRNETLGVSLESVNTKAGQLTVVEAMSAPPYDGSLLWYYDLRTPFTADWWMVYLAEANMGTKGLLLLALPILLLAIFSTFVGLNWLKPPHKS